MKDFTWSDLDRIAAVLAEELRPSLAASHQSILIVQRPSLEGIALMTAALKLGLDVILDEKGGYDRSDKGVFHASQELIDKSLAQHSEHFAIPSIRTTSQDLEGLKALFRSRTFSFSTSGSTGESKSIVKSSEGLLAEIQQLTDLYQMQTGECIVSLVRPFHIYGFLHCLLLPLFANATVVYWPLQSLLPLRENSFPSEVKLLVTVPAHRNMIRRIWDESRTERVVSSGGLFGHIPALELQGNRKHFDHFHEILGSTETGGIGHRLLEEYPVPFTLFDGIHFESRENGSEIFSPFLAPEASVLSMDRLEMQDHGLRTFAHLGRADRIFKYSGLRHSLSEVEEILKALTEAKTVIAAFEIDESIAQGGILYAWIEADRTNIDIGALQKTYLAKSNCPFPRRISVRESFPRDAQGKVSLKELKRGEA